MSSSNWTRWHAAGLFWRHAPDVRGRDRVFSLIKGPVVPKALATSRCTVHFGPGLVADVALSDDGSFEQVFFAAYVPPALAPVLDAVLSPGDCFYDVGANIGIYSLWASKLVGPAGEVHSFEPVPGTRSWLQDLVAQNEAANVSIRDFALSDKDAVVRLRTVDHASGISRIEDDQPPVADAASDRGRELEGAASAVIEVSARTMDSYVVDRRSPTLVKIDVEGHERSVFRGMRDTLARDRPVVVFEAPDTMGMTLDTDAIVDDVAGLGYVVWSLTKKGLAPYDSASHSHNLLALDAEKHEEIRVALAAICFARAQNC